MKITTQEIECAIARRFGTRQNIIVPNVSWGAVYNHECDILVIRPSGWAIEIEIKRSKSDLLADHKKNHTHNSDNISEIYFAIPREHYVEWSKLIPEYAGIICYWKIDANPNSYIPESDFIATEYKRFAPKRKHDTRAMTEKEMLKVAHLGTMRIWNLKDKLNNFKRIEK